MNINELIEAIYRLEQAIHSLEKKVDLLLSDTPRQSSADDDYDDDEYMGGYSGGGGY